MAEQVQAILERMVPYLKDLRNRHIFTSDEIQLIVERRRRSEYLLQRRSQAKISDYLRYIEDELHLERLRKLRKEKLLTELKNEEKEKKRKSWMMSRNNNDDDDDDEEEETTTKETSAPSNAYQTSGPGDSHIISHIHFLYQRTLQKFHYPIDVLLNYAEFSKEVKSFHMLSRVYAMGLQHHPREAGLWIEAASFEYFGYVAQDYESKNGKNDDEDEEGGAGSVVNSKIVGSSIKNARVLMQRGLRINKTSTELWLQYFALELHYVQKLRGRREILSLHNLNTVEEDSRIVVAMGEGDNERGEQNILVPTSLLPCQVIFKNAILAIPNDVQFRLRFIEACRMFPDTSSLEAIIMTSIEHDFGTSVEGWVARISYAEEQMKNRKRGKDSNQDGFLGRKLYDDGDDDGGNDESDDGKGSDDRPTKKTRFNDKLHEANSDLAFDLLQQALEVAPSSKLYLEGARFLRSRIQHLLDYTPASSNTEESSDNGDVSYLIKEGEDANTAVRRLTSLLEGLYDSAKKKNVSSNTLTLDHVDFLLSVDQPIKAEQILSNAITSMVDVDVRLWLRWAEISRQLERSSPSPTSPIGILRQALKRTPLHDRYAHILILTELMEQLMSQQSSQKTSTELHSLFQKLILLSQGLNFSPSSSTMDDDTVNDESGRAVNVASTVLDYLNYSIHNNKNSGDENVVRSIYTSLIYHSNYGKSCLGKTHDELVDMKSLYDACIRYEKDCCPSSAASANMKRKHGKKEKMAQKTRLNKLYTAAISFYSSGGSSLMWRNVVNNFQRDLDDLNCGL